MSWKRFILAAATEATAAFFGVATRIKRDAWYWLRAEDPNYLLWLFKHKRRFRPGAAPDGTVPVFSILLPVHNSHPRWLAEAIDSVRRQSFGGWELIAIDDASTDAATIDILQRLAATDPRIRLLHNPSNRGIAASTNRAAAAARGDWLLLLDHDDLLYPDALLTLHDGLHRHSEADVLYADEDRLSPRGLRYLHHFKPGFSPSQLEMHNYILHPMCVRRDAWQRIGGMRPAFDGSQDYDLLLRLWDSGTLIHHIPGMLYSWREGPTSMAGGADKPHIFAAGKRALAEHLDRRGETGIIDDNPEAEPGDYRIRFALPARPRLLLVAGSEPVLPADWRVHRIEPGADPLAAALAVQPQRFHAVVFLERSMAARDWPASLAELIGWCLRIDVGVVGGRVMDGAGRIVHAGQSLDAAGRLRADFRGRPSRDVIATRRYRDCLALAPAVLAVAGSRLEQLTRDVPLEAWPLALCLNARQQGLRVVCNPFAAFHTTGPPSPLPEAETVARLLHSHGIDRDPYLNPQLASTRWNDLRLPLQWPLLDRLAARHAARARRA